VFEILVAVRYLTYKRTKYQRSFEFSVFCVKLIHGKSTECV
jgi:hypothetical protein